MRPDPLINKTLASDEPMYWEAQRPTDEPMYWEAARHGDAERGWYALFESPADLAGALKHG